MILLEFGPYLFAFLTDFSNFCTMPGKEFSSFNRPRAHVIGALARGFGIFFTVTEADMPKDATTHIEKLAHILTKLAAEGVILSELALTLQCDNTSRECKNNIMLSFLTTLVSKGYLPRVQQCFVVSRVLSWEWDCISRI